MTKLLISLLALDIGFSLSKVYIFTWKSNYFAKKKQLFFKEKYLLGILYWYILLNKKEN